jgi:hypothetical protein
MLTVVVIDKIININTLTITNISIKRAKNRNNLENNTNIRN